MSSHKYVGAAVLLQRGDDQVYLLGHGWVTLWKPGLEELSYEPKIVSGNSVLCPYIEGVLLDGTLMKGWLASDPIVLDKEMYIHFLRTIPL